MALVYDTDRRLIHCLLVVLQLQDGENNVSSEGDVSNASVANAFGR